MRRLPAVPLGVLLLVAAACAHGSVTDGVFTSDDYRFSVELPAAPYERIVPKGALVALTDPATGVSFAVAASPDPYPGITGRGKSLDYIARDLLIFLMKKEYRVFEDATLSGEPAKHLTVAGVVDSNEMVFSAYVLRYNGAVYDIVMWCVPADFETASAVFQKMADTFTFLRETGQ